MIRTRLYAFSLALALAAGPVAAACADCCPPDDGALAMAPAADCCGDCSATFDRSPDRPSAALRAASPDVSVPALVVDLPATFVTVPVLLHSVSGVRLSDPSPPRASAPLRL